MSEWHAAKLGDVLTLQRGFDITKKFQRPGSVPVISSSGIASYHDEARAQAPGVVIGRKGSLGTVFFVDRPFWPHDTTLWVKDFKGNDPYFCHLLLKTLRLAELDVGSSNPTLNRNHAHLIPVQIPEVRLQRRISAVLEKFDRLIAINERRIALLEDLGRSLYREWFVRLRVPPLVAEPGPVPEGWKRTDLGSIATWKSGGTPSTKNEAYWDGGIPWITSGCLRTVLLSESDRTLTAAGVEAGSRMVDRDAVLLVVRGMSLLREVRAGIAERPLAFGQDCKALVAIDGVAPMFLAFTVLDRQATMHRMVELAGHGTGKLATDRIKALPVALPPAEVQQRFVAAVAPIRAGISAAMQTTRSLARTRDLLLPRLVAGRLDVSGIDLNGLGGLSGEG